MNNGVVEKSKKKKKSISTRKTKKNAKNADNIIHNKESVNDDETKKEKEEETKKEKEEEENPKNKKEKVNKEPNEESLLVTEEIMEDKNMEYIPHSSKDTVWLQKKWFFIIFILAVNIGCVFIVIFTRLSAYFMIPFITLSHVKDVVFVLISIMARVLRIEKRNWGKKVPLVEGSSIKMASIVTC